jgi:predicted alpha/beta-fold hydrolase
MQVTAAELANQGFTVVCFNQRGVANTPLLNSHYHCHGDFGDLREVIDYLSKQYQNIYGVGISIGANLIMKYAAHPD